MRLSTASRLAKAPHLLAFQLAHAKAQDAVHLPLNIEELEKDIVAKNGCWSSTGDILLVHSQVVDRDHYLQRPDLGRRLDEASQQTLSAQAAARESPYDLSIVIVDDGLSSLAIQKHVPELLSLFSRRFMSILPSSIGTQISRLAPLVIVRQGRVAIGDEVAERLNAKAVLVLIGERPGLSSPDSMGMYLTWSPKQGLTDESRNCISNVRPDGLSYEKALDKLDYLLHEAFRLRLTGVQLKEESQTLAFEK